MAVYDLYGSALSDIEEIKSILEFSLGVKFDAKDSGYQGGAYYKWGRADGENFVLKRNVDPLDGESAEMSFPSYKVLFYINDTVRSADLEKVILEKVEGFFLLRREDFA